MTNSNPVIWDPLLRIFHWSLTFFFLLAYLLEGDWLSLHSHAGYTVLLLVLFRVVWGVIGVTYARFSNFSTSPREIVVFLRQLMGGQAGSYVGHNPAGAAMIFALLVSLSITAFTGICLFAVEGSGPLANTLVSFLPGQLLENVHEFFADFTLVLVAVHIIGVFLTSFVYKENLTRAMITGVKGVVSELPENSKETHNTHDGTGG